jgi:transposase
MALGDTGLECTECERLENEFIRARNNSRKPKLSGQETTVTARMLEKLDEDERAALSTYMEHRIGH